VKFKNLVICLLFVSQLNAQEVDKPNKFELGVNVTRMLANVLVNQNSDGMTDFPLTFKINGTNRTFRLGFDAEMESQDNFSVDSRRIFLANRIGFENRMYLSDKWIFLYGWDIHSRYFSETSTNFNQIDEITQKDRSIGLGISPVMGFQFLFTDRIALEIESNILFLANRVTSDLTFTNAGQLNVSTEGYTYDIDMPDPRFLYLIVKF